MIDTRVPCLPLGLGLLVLGLAPLCSFEALAVEPRCPGSSSSDPAILFCDDFDGEAPRAGRDEKYFEYNMGPGNLFVDGVTSRFSLLAASKGVYGESAGEWTPADALGYARILSLTGSLQTRAGGGSQ